MDLLNPVFGMPDDSMDTRFIGGSVGFLVPAYRPGNCGIFDYSVRMATGMQALGVQASVLCASGISDPERLQAGDALVEVKLFDPKDAKAFKFLAVQYVASNRRQNDGYRKMIAAANHQGIHLMIHEIWRVPTMDYRLTAKENLVAFFQRMAVFHFIRSLRPKTIACSNDFYRRHLTQAGIEASLSPMPGNIPLPDKPPIQPESGIPDFFDRPNNEFIWASFGSLYGAFWSPHDFFGDMRNAVEQFHRPFKWVVIGNQKHDDLQAFKSAAHKHGFGADIHFTGAIDVATVDWILRNSDAAFTGTGRDFWQKSGGTLAAVERGLPVYFPRPTSDTSPRSAPSLYTDLSLLLREHKPNTGYTGAHSLRESSHRLLEILCG